MSRVIAEHLISDERCGVCRETLESEGGVTLQSSERIFPPVTLCARCLGVAVHAGVAQRQVVARIEEAPERYPVDG